MIMEKETDSDDLKWYHKAFLWVIAMMFIGLMKGYGEKIQREKKYKKVIKQNFLGFETIEWHEK